MRFAPMLISCVGGLVVSSALGACGSVGGGGSTGESGESGGPSCEPVYMPQTSFDIDLAAWPGSVESGVPVVLDCETTQAEVQGLGLVMNFDCDDGTQQGSVQITVAGLGVIDPPMSVGSRVELEFMGFDYGGDQADPQLRTLGFGAEEFQLRDEEGLLVGAFTGPNLREVYAPLHLSPDSPCGTPNSSEDLQGRMRVARGEGDDAHAEFYDVGVRGEWSAPGTHRYRIDVGHVVARGCCEVAWSMAGVIARLP